jgi:hypothetical protein
VRTGPYHEGYGADRAPTESFDRAKDKAEAKAKGQTEAEGQGEVMHVEFVKVLTVLLVIALVVAAWPEPPEDD